MNWQTSLKTRDYTKEAAIDYNSGLVLLGSCFTEHIGQKLANLKFDSLSNPLGICYNPISIQNHLAYLSESRLIDETQLFKTEKGFVHFDFHSSLSKKDKGQCYQYMQDQLSIGRKAITEASHIFISYGTAIVYAAKNGRVVNNCHKQAQSNFDKKLLTYEQVNQSIADTISTLRSFNNELKIIFTLSPVRHIKNGLINDRRSKSVLHTAINDQVDNNQNCYYFPSYEILVDELRDYRFYADDMIHPSTKAIDYIWSKFSSSFLSPETKKDSGSIHKIMLELNHRPLYDDTKSLQQFKISLLSKLKEKDKLGFNFSKEIVNLEQEIKDY